MKVALVCPYDWSVPGGVQSHVANLASYLSRTHEVRIFAPTSAPLGDREVDRMVHHVGRPVGVPFNASVAPIGLSPRVLSRVKRSLDSFGPHITHIHEPLSPLVSVAATLRGPSPQVATFHTWSDSAWVYKTFAPVVRTSVEAMAARIAVSPIAANYVAESMGIARDSITVVPNGVDTKAFGEAEPLPDLFDPERPLVLFVGRLEKRKGLEVLISAFLRLRGQGRRIRLCVVGKGPEGERCQDLVPASLRSEVLFVGRVSDEDLPRYHASSQIFCAPATGGESFGIVLLEAMAAGLPVVAANIPGYASVMQDRLQGRLFAPNDPAELAEALETVLMNPKLAEAFAAQGQETVARYDWSEIGRRINKLYLTSLA